MTWDLRLQGFLWVEVFPVLAHYGRVQPPSLGRISDCLKTLGELLGAQKLVATLVHRLKEISKADSLLLHVLLQLAKYPVILLEQFNLLSVTFLAPYNGVLHLVKSQVAVRIGVHVTDEVHNLILRELPPLTHEELQTLPQLHATNLPVPLRAPSRVHHVEPLLDRNLHVLDEHLYPHENPFPPSLELRRSLGTPRCPESPFELLERDATVTVVVHESDNVIDLPRGEATQAAFLGRTGRGGFLILGRSNWRQR
mmetsp:Transcript_23315/g.48508  ORF Transcript_23315/g.48508 Transcript_23315/m.48508 type:complete len:254 (-) Transcript_23315:556-1317(-)